MAYRMLSAFVLIVMPLQAWAADPIPSFLIGKWSTSDLICRQLAEGGVEGVLWYQIGSDNIGGMDWGCETRGVTKQGNKLTIKMLCLGGEGEEETPEGGSEVDFDVEIISDSKIKVNGTELVKCADG